MEKFHKPNDRELLAIQINNAIREATLHVVGHYDVPNEAHGRVLLSLIKAFSDSTGYLYVEPLVAGRPYRRPDIVLIAPEVGVLVLEIKGITTESIESIDGGKLMLRERGRIRPRDPFRQAERAMYQLKNEVEFQLRDPHACPLFNFALALPNISEEEWTARGYATAVGPTQILFREQIFAPQELRKRVLTIVRDALNKTGKTIAITSEQMEVVQRALGKADTINLDPDEVWEIPNEPSIGANIADLETLDKYYSREQQELSRLRVGDCPRLVRGVAGSGKSVVLAEMAARYLRRSTEESPLFDAGPEHAPNVAVVCFNRSLVPFLQSKVHTALRQISGGEIPLDRRPIITHLNGLMRHLTETQGWPIEYIPVRGESGVSDSTLRARQYIGQIRRFAAEHPEWYEQTLFDVIFVDEGQDFEPDEYALLLELIRPHPKTGEKPLIVFYDDAQNMYGRRRPNWKEIGIDVQRGNRSRVMKECFRNTRQIVELAFNVLLGTQAPPDVKVRTRTFADVSYLKDAGLVEEHADHFRVRFAEREGDPPVIREFPNHEEERKWVVQEIGRLINEEHVRPEDILVECRFRKDADAVAERIRDELRINCVTPYGDREDRDSFIFRKGHVTVSTTHGAKGYDAPVVFMVGCDQYKPDSTEDRAAFYVGATRAKLYLCISGVEGPATLLEEARKVARTLGHVERDRL